MYELNDVDENFKFSLNEIIANQKKIIKLLLSNTLLFIALIIYIILFQNIEC